LHFKLQDTGISCGNAEATLTGEAYCGTEVVGSDSVSFNSANFNPVIIGVMVLFKKKHIELNKTTNLLQTAGSCFLG